MDNTAVPTISEEEKKNIELFLKEYGELVAKYNVDYINFPVYAPDSNGNWVLTIRSQPISTKNRPVKSPFIPQ